MKNWNYLDLFSGIGGFHLGLKYAGFKFGWTGHSETDKYAEQVYHKHFPKSECLGDVRTIRTDRLPERISFLTFGFPCQDISIAGKRGGLGASRSGLFFEAMRIISECKPEIFIFENVKGLFSSSEGRDFEIILRTIADIGLYDCEWQLLNTCWFLPQNRERIYFIGHLRGKSESKVFPIGEGSQGKTGTQTETSRQKSRIRRNYSEDKIRVYSPKGYARTIRERDYKGGQLLQIGTSEHHNTADVHSINQESKIRRLTPIEYERLQGFPDNYHEGLSDTQAYKCYGNAVSVPVVKAIGEKLIKCMTGNS